MAKGKIKRVKLPEHGIQVKMLIPTGYQVDLVGAKGVVVSSVFVNMGVPNAKTATLMSYKPGKERQNKFYMKEYNFTPGQLVVLKAIQLADKKDIYNFRLVGSPVMGVMSRLFKHGGFTEFGAREKSIGQKVSTQNVRFTKALEFLDNVQGLFVRAKTTRLHARRPESTGRAPGPFPGRGRGRRGRPRL